MKNRSAIGCQKKVKKLKLNITSIVVLAGNVDACTTLVAAGAEVEAKDKDGLTGEREMFYLTTHSTHFIYSYMASDIWLRTILIVRKETHCRNIGYSY